MSDFTKTVIVDPSESGYPHTIQDGIKEIWDPDSQPPVTMCGVVIVEAGVYEISAESDIITVPSNVSLIGRGNVTVKIKGNVSAFRNYDLPNGNTRITISGFKIVVAKEAQASAPYGTHVIYMTNCSDCIVENVAITAEQDETGQGVDTEMAAILFHATQADKSENNIVRCCHIYDFGRTYDSAYNYGVGIRISTQYDDQNPTARYNHRNIIRNNFVSECSTCCYVSDSDNNVIEGNIFTDSQGFVQGHEGLLLECADQTIVSGNQLINNAYHGLYISGSEGSTVKGNIMKKNKGAGIHLRYAVRNGQSIYTSRNVFIGNICCENGRPEKVNNGIHIQEKSQRNMIYGNVCSNNTANGIRIHDSDTHNNFLVDNMCVGQDRDSSADISDEAYRTYKSNNMANKCYPFL